MHVTHTRAQQEGEQGQAHPLAVCRLRKAVRATARRSHPLHVPPCAAALAPHLDISLLAAAVLHKEALTLGHGQRLCAALGRRALKQVHPPAAQLAQDEEEAGQQAGLAGGAAGLAQPAVIDGRQAGQLLCRCLLLVRQRGQARARARQHLHKRVPVDQLVQVGEQLVQRGGLAVPLLAEHRIQKGQHTQQRLGTAPLGCL